MKFFKSLGLMAFLPMAHSFTVVKPIAQPLQPQGRLLRETSPTATSTKLNALPAMVDTAALSTLFMESVITTSVPTIAVCIVVAFAANAFRPKKNRDDFGRNNNNAVLELYNDLYGQTEEEPKGFVKFLGGASKPNKKTSVNLGVPSQQFIQVDLLNTKLDSFKYSMVAATQSKAKAAAQIRQTNFERALQKGADSSLSELSPHAKNSLLQKEEAFLKKGAIIMGKIQNLQAALTQKAIEGEMTSLGVSLNDVAPKPLDTNGKTAPGASPKKDETTSFFSKSERNRGKLMNELSKEQQALTNLELTFVKDVVSCLGPDRANGVRSALLGDMGSRAGGLLLQLQERPLSKLLQDHSAQKSLFVTQFPGDVSASQVKELREEVTAICRSAQPGDEALVVLQTGGGTVTGYGLAAAQLQRFKDHGMKLTICVEQVAASGGYMMCCVADKIVASPFAVLGSIGVISDIPNVYERLKEEGM